MATDTQEVPPGLDERYIAATNSSNLRLNPDAQCDATHLIASALMGNRMGQALLHLRGEWDAADKPPKASEIEILARAQELPKRKGKVDVKRARVEAMVRHAAAMRKTAEHLRGRIVVLGLMREWAQWRNVDPDLLSPALYHFLNPTCPACEGRGKVRMPDAPILGKECVHCAGTGTWPRPQGAQRIHEWLKGCAARAKRDRGGLLCGDIDAGIVTDEQQRRKERDRQMAASIPEDSPEDAQGIAEHFSNSMQKTQRRRSKPLASG